MYCIYHITVIIHDQYHGASYQNHIHRFNVSQYLFLLVFQITALTNCQTSTFHWPQAPLHILQLSGRRCILVFFRFFGIILCGLMGFILPDPGILFHYLNWFHIFLMPVPGGFYKNVDWKLLRLGGSQPKNSQALSWILWFLRQNPLPRPKMMGSVSKWKVLKIHENSKGGQYTNFLPWHVITAYLMALGRILAFGHVSCEAFTWWKCGLLWDTVSWLKVLFL